ncbi:MAG: FKBP-type peptidyl-prolyl cis-trans isomerase [Bacteroidales bacterium]|nr:FKBP-type peptidyl-prolyl cis-trans isomerase [Bacteroidales bacterium]
MLKKIEKILLTVVVVSFMAILTSCADNTDTQNVNNVKKQDRERLEEANRYLVKQEKEIINEYIHNSGNEYVETGTGLRYRIVNQGDSTIIKTGDIVVMEYQNSLINGEVVYSSDNDGLKSFVVGRGGVERGLEEAVLHLHKGDEAEVIMPSYLAYGLTGDGNKIPPRSILVYKLKIIDYK